jgi:hypothetical protein
LLRISLKSRSLDVKGVAATPALASLNRSCRNHCSDFSAALTTMAFYQSSLRWLEVSDLIADPEGPTFISYKVARGRLDRLRS